MTFAHRNSVYGIICDDSCDDVIALIQIITVLLTEHVQSCDNHRYDAMCTLRIISGIITWFYEYT